MCPYSHIKWPSCRFQTWGSCHAISSCPGTAAECDMNIPFLPVDSSFPVWLEMYSRNGSSVPQRCCIHDRHLHFIRWVHPKCQPTSSWSHSANWCQLPIPSLTDFSHFFLPCYQQQHTGNSYSLHYLLWSHCFLFWGCNCSSCKCEYILCF